MSAGIDAFAAGRIWVMMPVPRRGSAGVPEDYAKAWCAFRTAWRLMQAANLYATTCASNCIDRITLGRRGQFLCQDSKTCFYASPQTARFEG